MRLRHRRKGVGVPLSGVWNRPVAIPLGVDDMCRMSSSRIIAHRVRKVGVNRFLSLELSLNAVRSLP